MTLLLEIHQWRGFNAAGGGLLYSVTLGFCTLAFAPFAITKKLAELTDALKGVVGK